MFERPVANTLERAVLGYSGYSGYSGRHTRTQFGYPSFWDGHQNEILSATKMNTRQPRKTPSYGYDGTHPSSQGTRPPIFSYDAPANSFTAFNSNTSAGKTSPLRQFTGKERDSESGLDYFGASYYGSALGRWTTPEWSETPQAMPYASL